MFWIVDTKIGPLVLGEGGIQTQFMFAIWYIFACGIHFFPWCKNVSEFSVFTVAPSKIKVQTIQERKSRIWEMKYDKYTKSLAKNQVCAVFHMQDIQKNALPKFKCCMETAC